MIAADHIRASAIVIRSRFLSATEEPPSDELMPPPNRSDNPPPLPLWSKTKAMSNKLVIASNT